MAFWDNEKNKLKGFGVAMKTPAQIALERKLTISKPTAKPAVTAKPNGTGKDASGGVDPNAIIASIPEDVKRPTNVVLPPSTGQQTQALLVDTAQVLRQAKAKTAQVKQVVSQVKSTAGKLKGFFGFGAVDVTKAQKVQVTQQSVAIAKQAATEAKATIGNLKQTKQALVAHRQGLLKDKAQIANENAKLKGAISKKQKHKVDVEEKLSKVPKTITK